MSGKDRGANSFSKLLLWKKRKLQVNKGEGSERKEEKGAIPPLAYTPVMHGLDTEERVSHLPPHSALRNRTQSPVQPCLLPFTKPCALENKTETTASPSLPQLPHTTPTPLQPNDGDGGRRRYIWGPPETWVVCAEHWDDDYSNEDEMKDERASLRSCR